METINKDFVISRDGTKIGYWRSGIGPGIILLTGGMMASQNFRKLGEILSKDFTVYIPDRQGRGISAARKQHSLIAESEDLQALIEKTHVNNVFGLSSGAIITLKTMTTNSALKAALYEPPIAIDIRNAGKWFEVYELAMLKGNFGKAFYSILKLTGDTSWLAVLPGFIFTLIMNLAIRQAKVKEGEVPLQLLIAAFQYDYQIVLDSAGLTSQISGSKTKVLLIGGSKSADYLKNGLNQLKEVLPNSEKIELRGLGHLAPDNSGKPEQVAKELKLFFA